MRTVMLFFAMLFLLNTKPLLADEKPLVFGTLPLEKPTKLFEMYKDLVKYYETELGRPVRLEVGKDYEDAIEKFMSGHYDFGYLGPSPYIMITEKSRFGKDALRIIGTIETDGSPFYRAVIVAKKDNPKVTRLQDLTGKRFAFGSRESTLAFYMPAKMLMESGVLDKLQGYDLLGKHDAVVNAVYTGAFDAGGIKEDVAEKSADKIRVIAVSEPVWDFMLVARRDLDDKLFQRIRQLSLSLKDKAILEKIKQGVTGFVPSDDANYDNVRRIMQQVDARFGKP